MLFSGSQSKPVRVKRLAKGTFFYPDYHCRPRNFTGSCVFGVQELLCPLGYAPTIRTASCPTPKLLVGYTTDRELHPAPKVDIRLSKLYHRTTDVVWCERITQLLRCTRLGKPKRIGVNRCARRIPHRSSDR
jgi:hypothetical protein